MLVNDLAEQIRRFSVQAFGEQPVEEWLKLKTLKLAEETGEIAAAALDHIVLPVKDRPSIPDLAMECGDIIVVALDIIKLCGANPDTVLTLTMKKNWDRLEEFRSKERA